MFCIKTCCKYLFPCFKANEEDKEEEEEEEEEDVNYIYDTDTTIDIQQDSNTWKWRTSNPMLTEKLIESNKDTIFNHIK